MASRPGMLLAGMFCVVVAGTGPRKPAPPVEALAVPPAVVESAPPPAGPVIDLPAAPVPAPVPPPKPARGPSRQSRS